MTTEFQFFYVIASLLFLILIFSWMDARIYKRKMNQVIVRLDELIADRWLYIARTRPVGITMDGWFDENGVNIDYVEWLEKLNHIGEMGWELVTVSPIHSEIGGQRLEYMFKKLKED